MRLPFKGTYPITQIFGVRKERYQQFSYRLPDGTTKPLEGHNGVDFGTPNGTPLIAPHSGKVIEASFDANGYGNYVKIENDTEGSVLAHLDSVKVQVGFFLFEGDLIGYSGNTGFSTGAHVHWGYYRKPRNRGNGYGGYEDQMKIHNRLFSNLNITDPVSIAALEKVHAVKGANTLEVEILNTKYKIGDEIQLATDLPVGEAPGKESLSYGKIGVGYPAKVIGIRLFGAIPYYNIDQRHIGGGTGWVNAKAVDFASNNLASIEIYPSKPTVGMTYTVQNVVNNMVSKTDYEEIQKRLEATNEELAVVAKELSNAIGESQRLRDENLRLAGILAGFKALGIETPDDLVKEIHKKDEVIIGLQAQITQVLKRNTTLADELSKKDTEDATAIEEAMELVSQYHELKGAMAHIAQSIGTKPKAWDIVNQIDNLRKAVGDAYNKAKREAEEGAKKAERKRAQQTQPANRPQQSGIDWLLQLLQLK